MPLEPSSGHLRVGTSERHHVEEALKDAYCDGRLDKSEFDRRLGLALTAQTRRDLAPCLAGLPPRPVGVATFPASPPPSRVGTGVGAIAHWSGLFTWIFGPLLFHALAQPGSSVRREAAKAFNFQLVYGLLALVAVVLPVILGLDALAGGLALFGWTGWVVLTVLGGARASTGQPFVNPVGRVIGWQPLDPRR